MRRWPRTWTQLGSPSTVTPCPSASPRCACMGRGGPRGQTGPAQDRASPLFRGTRLSPRLAGWGIPEHIPGRGRGLLPGTAWVTPLVGPQGLGAPAGAVLAGRREFVAEAWRVRKLLGGGMRQAGVLAAAARVGLEHAEATLRRDHDNTRRFAEGILGSLGTPGGTGAHSLTPLPLTGCAGFQALLRSQVLPCPTARRGPSLIPHPHRRLGSPHPALAGTARADSGAGTFPGQPCWILRMLLGSLPGWSAGAMPCLSPRCSQ